MSDRNHSQFENDKTKIRENIFEQLQIDELKQEDW